MKYSYETRVGYSEIARDGNMTKGAMVDKLQDCSNFQSEDIGVGLSYLMKNRKAWLINSWQIDFEKPLAMGDKIKVSTWAYDFDKIFGYRNFTIENEAGEMCAKANSIWFMINLDTFRPCRITAEDTEKYGKSDKLEMEYLPKKVSVPDDMEEVDKVKIRNYHIDTNGHMNNAWYIKIAMEYISFSEQVKRVRVEYKNSAMLNDIVTVYYKKEEKKEIVTICDEDSKPYAVLEFTFA